VVFYVFAALSFVFSRTGTDPDLWGHLLFGRDFWVTGLVNRPDPYSFVTQGQEWFNHEWLAEAISWKAWEWGGTWGLIGLKTGMGLLMVAALYRHLRRRGVMHPAAGLFVMLASTLLALGMYSLRPQAFTYVCFLALLLVLERADRGDTRGLWWLPPIFAAWANLHGGFLAGLAILGVFALGAVAEGLVARPSGDNRTRALRHPLVLVALASALATWINPYGLRLWGFLRTAFAARGEIAEWNPIQVASPLGIVFLLLVLLAWAGVARGGRRLSPARLLALFVMSVAPLMAIRHAPLFALAVVVLAGEHIAAALGALRETDAPATTAGVGTQAARTRPVARRILAGLLLAQGVPILFLSARNVSCIAMDEGMPVRAVSLVKASGVRGNLALLFDWGEYAIWHLAPGVKVSIDGRRETIYSDEDYWRDHRFTFALGQGWDRLLTEEPVDVVLASRHFPVFSAMKLMPGWELVYEDRQAGLFARAGTAAAAALRAVPASAAREAACFP
jgi:hypothetical protein